MKLKVVLTLDDGTPTRSSEVPLDWDMDPVGAWYELSEHMQMIWSPTSGARVSDD